MSQQHKIKRVVLISLFIFSGLIVDSCAMSGRPNPAPIEKGITSEQLKKMSDTSSQNNNRPVAPKKVQQATTANEDESAVQVSTIKEDTAPVAGNNSVPHCPASASDSFVFPLPSWTVYKQFTPELKGVDVKAKYGSSVYAARAGKVVYSGDGLVGYGNVIIVKHDDGMLTAYAFNKVNLVKVGEVVKQCQRIAEIGYMYKQISGLHFEIRKSGKPLNPLDTIANK